MVPEPCLLGARQASPPAAHAAPPASAAPRAAAAVAPSRTVGVPLPAAGGERHRLSAPKGCAGWGTHAQEVALHGNNALQRWHTMAQLHSARTWHCPHHRTTSRSTAQGYTAQGLALLDRAMHSQRSLPFPSSQMPSPLAPAAPAGAPAPLPRGWPAPAQLPAPPGHWAPAPAPTEEDADATACTCLGSPLARAVGSAWRAATKPAAWGPQRGSCPS